MKSSMVNQQILEENSDFELLISTVIGQRDEQQDCFGYEIVKSRVMVVICDGMGGHRGGRDASNLTVSKMLSVYGSDSQQTNFVDLIKTAAISADKAVHNLANESSVRLNAGSTLAAVEIRDNKLSWVSVGDSRGYFLRGNEFVQFTVDHNYATVIEEKKAADLISDEEYFREIADGDALISYIGIGNLELIDYNNLPVALQSGDVIALMTDGLYKNVSDTDMAAVLINFTNISEAAQALEFKVRNNSIKTNSLRDNMTFAIIKIK